jgi:hypothetical protein
MNGQGGSGASTRGGSTEPFYIRLLRPIQPGAI